MRQEKAIWRLSDCFELIVTLCLIACQATPKTRWGGGVCAFVHSQTSWWVGVCVCVCVRTVALADIRAVCCSCTVRLQALML